MARVEADASGKLVRFVTADRESMGSHPQMSTSLAFDDVANAALVTDLSASTDAYTLTGGVLRKGGVEQSIAADGPATTDARQVRANQAVLFAALRAGTANGTQVQRVLAFLLRQFLQG